jgi:hypothetical protein
MVAIGSGVLGMLRLILVSCVLLLAGCSSSPFVPSGDAFIGIFNSDEQLGIGDLSFTATAEGVAGTGTLHSGELNIPVAISANVNGQIITGQVANSNLGSGSFIGSFNTAHGASGTFTFSLITGTDLSGTWSASTDLPHPD